MKRHHQLLIALFLGIFAGVILHPYYQNETAQFFLKNVIEPTGQIFLRLIFMVVVPMIFSSLVLGVYQLAAHQGLGRVARKTFLYTVIASSASVVIGVALVNIFRIGDGVVIPSDLNLANENLKNIALNASNAKSMMQALLEIIPTNPLGSAVRALDGELISLMFFALMFGFAFAKLKKNDDKEEPILITVLEQIYAITMKIVDFAMNLAPYAVGALVFSSTFKFGHQILISLSYFVLTVVVALLLQQFVVYSLLLKSKGIAPIAFFKKCRDVYLYAFATSSSNATLPQTLECAEKKLKLSPESSRFVLTIGSTANQNGTALFEGITVLFLAQVYHIDLTLMQQVQVVMMSILAGIGTAGVPGGSLPLIMIILRQVGVPAEGIGIVLGVDRFLDMCRTTVNVSGDLVIAALVEEKTVSIAEEEVEEAILSK